MERVAAGGSGRYRFRPRCRAASGRKPSGVDRDDTNGVRTSVRLRSAGTVIGVLRRLWRRAVVVLLQAAWLSLPATAGAQTAQAVRVPRDSGSAPAASGNGEHRFGPPESVRERDAQLEAAVPTRYAPPAGMCRVWVGGVPAERQPAPTECAKAIRVRSPNSHVVFGKPRPAVPDGPGGGNPGANPGIPGLSAAGRENAGAPDRLQPPADGHTTGSVAPAHPITGGESGPGAPAAANTPKPAPAPVRAPDSHFSPPRQHASSPPKVTTRPRR
jgi:hypothetical protein